MKNMVRIRVHRTISTLCDFLDDKSSIWMELNIEWSDRFICLYRNTNNTYVLIWEDGFHFIDKNSSVFYYYESILEVETREQKSVVNRLTIIFKNHERINVQIDGERGKFKDVFAFQRFFMRVIEDYNEQS